MAGEWGAPRKQVRDAVDPSGFGGQEERMRMLEGRVAKLEHGAFSEFVSFGLDGIKIKGGGSLRVLDGGDVVVDPDGMVRSASFDGDLTAGEVGTIGWAMNDIAAALPNLLLRPGSVGNDVLTNPVDVDGSGDSGAAFNISTTKETKATVTLTPPSWCDKAIVLGVANATGVNTSADLGFLTGQVFINGGGGGTNAQPASGGNGTASVGMSAMRVFNPDTTIVVEFQVWSQAATFGTNGSNLANLDVIAVYLRA